MRKAEIYIQTDEYRLSDYIEGWSIVGVDNVFRGTYRGDNIEGTDDNDTIYGNGGDDYIEGNDGADKLHGGAGADNIYGGYGNDYIEGNGGNDKLYGGSGSDTIYGGDGDDEIYGGAGDDNLYGSTGTTTFVFTDGSGTDLVYNQGGTDIIDFTGIDFEGISFSTLNNGGAELYVYKKGAALEIKYNLMSENYDRVKLADYFANNPDSIPDIKIKFNTNFGEILYNLKDIAIVSIDHQDSDSDLNIAGTFLNDFIEGGSGNDTINGGAGNDSYYLFNLLPCTIEDASEIGSTDTLKIYAEYPDIKFFMNIVVDIDGNIISGNDLFISSNENFGNTEKSIKIVDQFANNKGIETFESTWQVAYSTSEILNNIRQSTANWIAGCGYTSAQDIINSGDVDLISTLQMQFNNSVWV